MEEDLKERVKMVNGVGEGVEVRDDERGEMWNRVGVIMVRDENKGYGGRWGSLGGGLNRMLGMLGRGKSWEGGVGMKVVEGGWGGGLKFLRMEGVEEERK